LEGGVGEVGDDEVGGGYGENEMMIMELSRVWGDIDKMVVRGRIDEGEEGKDDFGEVRKGYVDVSDEM
uniref:TerD family protein n=1 Tax=Bacillus pumilus TaxID=1408 RepID=UPI0011A4CEEB